MSSRSATVLVIFIVAVISFCLASVFASMTGPISILPNESDSDNLLDNISTTITDEDVDSGDSYTNQNYNDYSDDYSKSDDDTSDVETTTDSSKTKDSTQDSKSSTDSSSKKSTESSKIETTVDDSSSENPNVETTTG